MKKFYLIFFFALTANLILSNLAFGQTTAVTLRDANTGTTNGATLTIIKPSGLAVGDVMVACIVQSDDNDGQTLGDATLTGVNSWTFAKGGQFAVSGGNSWWYTILYRVANAADVAGANFIFAMNGNTDDAVGGISAFFNVNATGGVGPLGAGSGPFDVAIGALGTGTNATITAPGISTVTNGAGIVMFAMSANDNNFSTWAATSPAALTESFDVNNNGGADKAAGSGFAVQSALGATGSGSVSQGNSNLFGGVMLALRSTPVPNAGPDQLIPGTTVTLNGTASPGTASSWAWTKTSGPAGQIIVSPSSPSTLVTGLVPGTYVFRLTIDAVALRYDEVTVTVITGTNLWATSSNGTQVSSFTVNTGVYVSGPTNIFAPDGGSTAALGRSDKPSATAGYFYWLPNDGTSGIVNVYGASAAGNNETLIGTLDLNGAGNGNSLGYVRLGMAGNGVGWILARENTTNALYLASFTPNGVNPVAITVVDASVTLAGVGVDPADFVNGDVCLDANGVLIALANDGSGTTQIFTGAPAGAATILTKKWDLVDGANAPFTGTVNGVALATGGALYISTATGLFYINTALASIPFGTIPCTLTFAVTGLQDLASNIFPTTIVTPVKMSSFNVTKQGSNAVLDWTTVTEINSDHFEIERSTDGVRFSVVGTQQAAGNSVSAIQYQFIDPITATSGNLYYRLKTVDVDRKTEYSKIVILRLNGSIVKDFVVFPNPFRDDLKIQMRSERETEVTIRINNAMGQAVVSRKAILQRGDNVIVLTSELKALSAGMHVLEIITEEGKISQKIIKR